MCPMTGNDEDFQDSLRRQRIKFKMILDTKIGRKTMMMQDTSGQTPVHRMAMLGYDDIVRMAVKTPEGKEALETKDKSGQTPLHLASAETVAAEILETDAGRRAVLMKDSGGQTPLHTAIALGHCDVVRAIVGTPEGRKALYIKDHSEFDALRLATELGVADVLREAVPDWADEKEQQQVQEVQLQEQVELLALQKERILQLENALIAVVAPAEQSVVEQEQGREGEEPPPRQGEM